jgi:hypothetical protein
MVLCSAYGKCRYYFLLILVRCGLYYCTRYICTWLEPNKTKRSILYVDCTSYMRQEASTHQTANAWYCARPTVSAGTTFCLFWLGVAYIRIVLWNYCTRYICTWLEPNKTKRSILYVDCTSYMRQEATLKAKLVSPRWYRWLILMSNTWRRLPVLASCLMYLMCVRTGNYCTRYICTWLEPNKTKRSILYVDCTSTHIKRPMHGIVLGLR